MVSNDLGTHWITNSGRRDINPVGPVLDGFHLTSPPPISVSRTPSEVLGFYKHFRSGWFRTRVPDRSVGVIRQGWLPRTSVRTFDQSPLRIIWHCTDWWCLSIFVSFGGSYIVLTTFRLPSTSHNFSVTRTWFRGPFPWQSLTPETKEPFTTLEETSQLPFSSLYIRPLSPLPPASLSDLLSEVLLCNA